MTLLFECPSCLRQLNFSGTQVSGPCPNCGNVVSVNVHISLAPVYTEAPQPVRKRMMRESGFSFGSGSLKLKHSDWS